METLPPEGYTFHGAIPMCWRNIEIEVKQMTRTSKFHGLSTNLTQNMWPKKKRGTLPTTRVSPAMPMNPQRSFTKREVCRLTRIVSMLIRFPPARGSVHDSDANDSNDSSSRRPSMSAKRRQSVNDGGKSRGMYNFCSRVNADFFQRASRHMTRMQMTQTTLHPAAHLRLRDTSNVSMTMESPEVCRVSMIVLILIHFPQH